MKIKNLLILISSLISSVAFAQDNVSAEKQKDTRPEFMQRADKFYKDSNVIRNLVYKVADGEELSMDLILPENVLYEKGSPVVMYIHGGGWAGGARYVLHANTFKQYTSKGIAVACISYRLVKEGRGVLECITDCKDAARFLVKNAKTYNLDPSRFATTGHSAGAHLSLLTALAPNDAFVGDEALKKFKPNFVCVAAEAPAISFYDPQTYGNKSITKDMKLMRRLLCGDLSEKEELAKKLSPMDYLSKKSPAMLVVHGDQDPLLAVEGARLFVKKAEKLGANISYIEVANGNHSFDAKEGEKVSPDKKFLGESRILFLTEHLTKGLKEIKKN